MVDDFFFGFSTGAATVFSFFSLFSTVGAGAEGVSDFSSTSTSISSPEFADFSGFSAFSNLPPNLPVQTGNITLPLVFIPTDKTPSHPPSTSATIWGTASSKLARVWEVEEWDGVAIRVEVDVPVVGWK